MHKYGSNGTCRKMRGVEHVAHMEETRIRRFDRKILGTGAIWKIYA
jgi:hypothetical protein